MIVISNIIYDCNCFQFMLHFRRYQEHFLENISLETEKKALKVLHICQERNMSDQGELSV